MRTGKVSVIDTPAPRIGRGRLLVRTAVSLISPGTEKSLIEMGRKSLAGKALARPDLVRLALNKAKREGFFQVFHEAMARLDEPMPLGYSSSGTVVELGPGVTRFAPGDSVACAGFGFASHAEFVSVPQELCVRLPKAGRDAVAVSPDEASFVMLGGIALQGVRCAELSFGSSAVVVGLGLIGLLTVQILRAYGCDVFGVDIDPTKVALARSLGCPHAIVLGKQDIDSLILNRTGGRGADAVLLTAATKDNAPILLAERLARPRARIVLVGVSEIHLTRKAFWDKELVFTVSKASGPSEQTAGMNFPTGLVPWTERRNHEEFIRLLQTGGVRVAGLVTHRFPVERAASAYEMILKGRERYVGVVLDYPADAPAARHVGVAAHQKRGDRKVADLKRVGLIGAGMFTRNVFWPIVAKTPGLSPAGIAANTGVNAQHLAKRFGFPYTTTDYHELLKDPSIGSVFITTRHDLHGKMASEAIRAGKRVFVEKPLGLTVEELNLLKRAMSSSHDPVLMVGFNRRYAPLTLMAASFLADRSTPMQILYRVNAGYIPPEHWTQDEHVGGGRIMGEACHFIDLMQFLTGADPVAVTAAAVAGATGKYLRGDNVGLTIEFSDGSVGSLVYTAMGSKAFSRERMEVYSEERVVVIDDFRSIDLISGAKKTRKRLGGQDMGYRGEIDAFFEMDEQTNLGLFRQAVLTTLTSLAAVESLRSGKRVAVPSSGLDR